MSSRLADYKTLRTINLQDQLKNQNKTERRAPLRHVQLPRRCKSLSAVLGCSWCHMQETSPPQFPSMWLLQAFICAKDSNTKKVQSLLQPSPLTGNMDCLPQSQYRVSKSTRAEISNFQSSLSLSVSLPSSCTIQQQKMGEKMWQSEHIINNFLLPHSFGCVALLGYKQHVSPLTPHPTVVLFFSTDTLQNPLGWNEDRKQEAPKPGSSLLFSLYLY